MRDDDDTSDILRRRRKRTARGRRLRLLAALAGLGGVFLLGAGLLAYALWPRQRVVVAVGGGVATVSAGPAAQGTPGEPTEAEWADLLNHPWWRGKITKPAAAELINELQSSRLITLYFNRVGKSVVTRDEAADYLYVGTDTDTRQVLRRRQYEELDAKLGLVKQLGEFKAVHIRNGVGQRSRPRDALRALWLSLDEQPYPSQS